MSKRQQSLPVEPPLLAARRLLELLHEVGRQELLDEQSVVALEQDEEFLTKCIERLEAASSRDDIEGVWIAVRDMQHSFGGYVGGETGGRILSRTHELIEAMADTISTVRKREYENTR